MEILIQFLEWISNFICEPVTVITDFILAVFCIWYYKSILNFNSKKSYQFNWAMFFLCMALVTMLGSWAHAISCKGYVLYHKIVWGCMLLASGTAVYFAQMAAIHLEIKSARVRRNLQRLAVVQLICFVICVFVFMDFRVVAFDSLIGLVEVVILCFPKNTYHLRYKLMVSTGFLISFFTVYINQKKLSLSVWFNHNDVSHVIMFISLWFIYKGISYRHELEFYLK